ncbi:AAA domain-containing protein [Actinosynnema sp. CA-248983]
MTWRSEVVAAVDQVLKSGVKGSQADWRVLGRANPSPEDEDGWYVLDLRRGGDRPPAADSFDQLCLADKEGPDRGTSIPVERLRVADGVLRIKVAGRVPADCDLVWTVRLTPRHLWQKLREGLAALDDAGLADKLAAGRLDPLPTPSGRDHPPGFLPRQRRAYQACVEPGLHAVWGPPGTGKTRVLARAIEDLVRDGKRVLLVSTANVAVDNALKEVIKHVDTRQGQVIRVGPPHLAELAANDDVQLHRRAARTTADVDAERIAVQADLAELEAVDHRLTELGELLADHDHRSFLAATARIERSAQLTAHLARLDEAKADLVAAQAQHRSRLLDAESIDAELARVQPQRALWQRIGELRTHALHVENSIARRQAEIDDLEFTAATARGWLARRRATRRTVAARQLFDQVQRNGEDQLRATGAELERLTAEAGPVTEAYLTELDSRAGRARHDLQHTGQLVAAAERRAVEISLACDQLAAAGVADNADREFVARSHRLGLPALHAERERLLETQRSRARDRAELEERLRELNSRIARLRRNAEGEIVGNARVVATTLARSRAHPAVARERFDVVLVDEAGAAMLAEVLLAVAQARRTAVLLGDFLQLGPVHGDIGKTDHALVRKWVLPDGFTHCGIRRVEDVAENPGAVALLHQFRFGPNLRELANRVVYGVLEDGVTAVSGVRPRDTEIVIVDVNDLPELNMIHRSSRFAGWWPVGALLARSLAEHHGTEGEVGVVTTFKQQVEATYGAIKDAGRNLATAVGTAHSFQGREFDTVVFDLVEDGQGWISKAKWSGNDFERDGVRLFGVGITRARHRLYLIVNSRVAVKHAVGGTPLGVVGDLARAGRIQWVRAGALLGMADQTEYKPVSSVEAELNEVLRGLVDITDIDDEVSFHGKLRDQLSAARDSIWMWSPWVGAKGGHFIPLIADAVARGVRVRVFCRDDRDFIQRNPSNQKWLAELKATGAKLIRAHVEHKKIVVVDERVVLIGSHNPLSQRGSREVMLTCRGSAFARRLLGELAAEDVANPPRCAKCGGETELRRSMARNRGMEFFWRCPACKSDQPVVRQANRA